MKRFFIAILSPLKSPILILLLSLLFFAFVSDSITGDLGKIGQIVFSKNYHLQDKFVNVPIPSIDQCDTTCFVTNGVLFLGDSFTGSIYPNLLSSILQKYSSKFFAENIESPEETFVALSNIGVELPKIVVLESVERSFVFRLCDLNFSSNTNPIATKSSSIKPSKEKQTDYFSFYKNKMINNHAVLHVSLKDSLFSCPRKEKDLFFYYCDLELPDEEQVQTAICKLDTLFLFAKEKGIQLFYIVAADKYDVYQEFAIDNAFPKKEVLEKFVKFEANPYYLNTKPILVENARQGVEDLYYADDTHWSPIGAQIVAKEIARRMDSLGILQD